MSVELDAGAVLGRIFEEAKAKGLSQRDLADQSGLTAEGLSRLKKRGKGRLDTVERLASLVGMRLELVPVGQPSARPNQRIKRPSASAASFRDRHPELVWSNSRASNEVFIQRALLDPRFDVILDAATEFGPTIVERQWRELVEAGSIEARRAAPTTERILRHIRDGYEQATRRHA
ncbi:hypothetical protein G3N59_36220 [Paraburkholderia sp. Ac-20340]|uniref:helix-turn-helix domain-containing protein n=1 Tax=Paraburkholderia sp. Ac-20340 TaxID=2703888 RepID=UPI00197EB9A9|nr:hypothetical protein [Paraburkholderia sp. Ac-20340]MBN3858852.1 hypothetical protein [Paraburkholderia sp. Ac-20340]